jgi:hypothetical protein
MRKAIAVLVVLAGSAAAQSLTREQKESDFRNLVDTMNNWYAPADWKKQLFGFDALDLKPWLEKVAQTQTDLDFYELCVDYVALLKDTHSSYSLPSDFIARLGFTVDLFEGKVLIDSIDRNLLPAAAYPFAVGDELVSVDGVPALELTERFMKYSPQGNDRASMRLAANRIPTRAQSRMPHAPEAGDQAVVEIRRQSGATETYTIKWTKTGTPLKVGPVPMARQGAGSRASAGEGEDYMAELERLQHSGVSAQDVEQGVLNYGSRNPIFLGGMGAGSGFTRRFGGAQADFFYSGVFDYQGLKIGFLRIPSYSPPSTSTALQQLDREIDFFELNVDGLIVDGMRNPGGNLCFGENVMQRLSPDSFWTTGFELRAMQWRVMSYYNLMINAKSSNAAPHIIQQYELLYQAMADANRRSRGVTEPIPICTSSLWRDPFRAADGHVVAFSKPVMMLIDEFSTSTGDSVPSMFQENRRGLLYGMRSNGAGGNNTSVPVGAYTEGAAGVTMGIQARHSVVSIEGYPATNRLENVGVHPDVVNDYMTRENLLQGGAPFVRQFLERMAQYIRAGQ